ncbi:peptidoglycan recognition family protein [Nonomuraea sp. NPDC049486]|uniref:peptidoglycan recognition protein family protein n=1 Tax=Nonomuraea sp. NPDC049486 TaxID=3155773 RepID=UPI003419C1BA
MASIVSRAGWGARKPRTAPTRLARTKGVKVHYTGGHVDPRIVDDHARCIELMMQIQIHHMNGNGWSDFAYNLAACPHGRLFEGRGFEVMSAANGSGLNTDHYAILGLVGNSGFTQPNSALLNALRDGIDLLRKRGAGPEIKGHRDGYSTDCPGGPLYAWVRAGAPRPDPLEDDVSADDLWHKARIKRKKGTLEEREVSPASFLQELEMEQDAQSVQLDRIEKMLGQLLAK